MIRAYWRNALLVLLCACAFGIVFRLGLRLEMDRRFFSFRYLGQNQVAAALSSLVPGQPYDYMANSAVVPVATRYWNEEHDVPLQTIVDEARHAIELKNGGSRGWVVDDKGYVDLLGAAFRLFGLHKRSVYLMYFIVLGAPMAVYAAYFFRRRAYLFVLLSVILALYATTPILAVNDQLSGLHEQRFFSVVGVVPTLTLLLIMSEATLSPAAIVVVVWQVAALVFVYFCRNDALWQTIVLVLAVPLSFWRLQSGSVDRTRLAVRVIWPLATLLVALAGLDYYKRAQFNRAYYTQGYASHSYSHNLIMGFSFNPRLASEYDLAVNDMKVVQLVGRRMVARGELKSADDAVEIFNTDFNRYAAEVRGAMTDIVKAHPLEVALTIPYKAPQIYDEYRYVAGSSEDNPLAMAAKHALTPEPERRARQLYYRPFGLFILAALTIGALLAFDAAAADWRQARTAVIMVWLGSLLVPVTAIPMMYILGPSFVTTPLAAYVFVVSMMMMMTIRWYRA
jgi:hypothetical protein